MNKIELGHNKTIKDETGYVKITNEGLRIEIPAYEDSILKIKYEGINTYNTIEIVIGENARLELYNYKYKENDEYYNYKIILKENSKMVYNRFYFTGKLEETLNVYMDGQNSEFISHFSTISNDNQNFMTNIYHNNVDTSSYLINRGINKDNSLIFDVNTYVKKGCANVKLNQVSKIIKLGNSKSTIKPNLYIDENDVEASHGASIGRFREEELFYLKSRGLSQDDSYKMLIKAFLISQFKQEMREKLEEIIDKKGGEFNE